MNSKIPKVIKMKVQEPDKSGFYREIERTVDLGREDLAMAATFESRDIGLSLFLVNAQEYQDVANKQWVKVPNTEVRINFKGGKFNTRNSNLMRLVMQSKAFKNGTITIDQEDASGLWRKMGLIEAVPVQTIKKITSLHPDAETFDFEAAISSKPEAIDDKDPNKGLEKFDPILVLR